MTKTAAGADETKSGGGHNLPLARLFPSSPDAAILDCLLSNRGIPQSVPHIIRHAGVGRRAAAECLGRLVSEGIITERDGGGSGGTKKTTYVADTSRTRSRTAGLYAYYRATMSENLDTIFGDAGVAGAAIQGA